MQGLPFFSQYLNGQVNQRLTPCSPPVHGGGLGVRLSPQLADSTQLIVKLKFKDLKKDFLDILFFHGRHLPGDNEYQSVLIQYYITLYVHLSSKKKRIHEVTIDTYGRK
jgi:hypothetical protein